MEAATLEYDARPRTGHRSPRADGLRERGPSNTLDDFGDMFGALDRLPFPMFVIARNGVIRWFNLAAESMFGEKRGEHFSRLVAPQSRAMVNAAFAMHVLGASTEPKYGAVLLDKDGGPVNVEIRSVAVEGRAGVEGVLGAIELSGREVAGPLIERTAEEDLTPRQAEVLAYLARGYKTDQMATTMGLATHTVRNHVRAVLHRLCVHSRLEAVATARTRGLV